MSAPSNPSFALGSESSDGLSADTLIRYGGRHSKDPEAPLMQTVYYTYHETNSSFTYLFEVVDHGVKTHGEHVACHSKVPKLLDDLIDVLNRQWRRLMGNDKDNTPHGARR